MRDETILKFGDKQYTFALTIGRIAKIENELGESFLGLIAPQNILKNLTVERIKTILKYGLDDVPQDDDFIYDLMDAYIDDNHTLDELVSEIITVTLVKSHFFVKQTAQKVGKK